MEKSLKILLADMNNDLRASLTQAMHEDGNMELLGVATTGRETLRLCEQLRPDVLLLELVLPELDGLAVLRALKEKEHKPLVLIHTGFASPLAVSMAMEAGAAYFLSKPCPPELIVERIRCFASTLSVKPQIEPRTAEKPAEKKSFEYEVAELLRELGIAAQLKGYRYLQEAVAITVRDGGELQMVTKCLYPAIAKRFSTTSSRVERSIRHAVELSWARGNPELLRICFGNSVSPNSRPTNSQFIAGISEYMLLKEKEM